MAKEEYFKWAESVLDPSKTFEKPEALADIKIVELCTLILGPSLPAYLSELGATVFKVELPGAGDTMRSLTPFA
jgi:crotonobetainyl-CoA:carnitine CoA-transferase CaiB-like acyl-CoA transferase